MNKKDEIEHNLRIILSIHKINNIELLQDLTLYIYSETTK